jgi:hypothetical protein
VLLSSTAGPISLVNNKNSDALWVQLK